MQKSIARSLVGLILVFTATAISFAQIKQVQMKIDGYLCGN